MTQSIREKAIEAMARKMCWRTNGQFRDCASACLSSGKCHGNMDSDDIDRASVAFNAAISVLMEPNEAMLNAARDWALTKYGQGVGNDGATGCLQAMLKAASA